MKHEKELQPILTAIFCLNRTSEHEDKDISLILDYAFRRFLGCNTNMLYMACAGGGKEEIRQSALALLGEDTGYNKYLEEYTK